MKGTNLTRNFCLHHLPGRRFLFVGGLLTLIFSFSLKAHSKVHQPPNMSGYEESAVINRQKDQRIMRGRVADESDSGIPGVSVLVKGTNKGTVTDENGEFSLNVPESGGTLLFSFVGMEKQEIVFTDEHSINVTLQPASNNLADVVVTGYQTISRERATGSFVKLTTEGLEDQRPADLNALLEGRVAGLNDGIIRGTTSMNGVTSPLYVIDGFPVENTRYTPTGGITEQFPDLNLEDIESITVLKDAAATSIYGARAANGVVVIETKKAAVGETNISFSSSLTFSPYKLYTGNLTNSGDIVELEQEWAQRNPMLQATDGSAQTYAQSLLSNAVFTSLGMQSILNYYAGSISESDMNATLGNLAGRGYQYYNDAQSHAKRNLFFQQYNIGIGKAGNRNNFNASVTYKNNKFEDIHTDDQSVGISLRNSTEINSWLSVDLGTYLNYGTAGNQTYDVLNPGFNYQLYNRLIDDEGNPFVSTAGSRLSVSTINAINNYGLYNMDITPLDEIHNNIRQNKNFSNRSYGKVEIRFADWIKYHTMFQYEYGVDRSNLLMDQNSFTVRNRVNQMASVSTAGSALFNLPYGNIYEEVQQYSNAYNFRQQLSVNKTFNGKHDLTVIAGTETRHSKLEYRSNTLYNFDPEMLSFTPVNQNELMSLTGMIMGGYTMTARDFNQIRELVNRFVSVYGNAGYTYDGRYTATGSLRWDRSNLWGTDSRYQNKPAWSVGAGWNISNEDFFDPALFDMLKLRMSYGIGGNIAKDSAPYMTASYFESPTVGGRYGYISSRPNPLLSWEKTATTNIGIDFSTLSQRLNGTVEFYNKAGSDLLANTQGVPTEGWGYSTYTINNGKMQNRGVELTLNGSLIRTQNFGWDATLLYGYNKNEVVYVNVEAPVYFLQLDYPSEFPRVGTPYNSIYGYEWAGLSETGLPQVYDSEGNAVSSQPNDLESIVNIGTTVPKHSGSFSTSFHLYNFDLSMLFIYQAGHKVRNTHLPMLANSYNGAAGGYITNISVVNKDITNRWKQPGDELTTDVPRAVFEYDSDFSYALHSIYSYAGVNVLDASNVRLSNVSLAYRVPENLLSNLNIDRVRLYFNMENVATLAKSDDAKFIMGGYNSPNYVFGLNVNF